MSSNDSYSGPKNNAKSNNAVKDNSDAGTSGIEAAAEQVVIDLLKLQRIRISNIGELRFRRKRIINNILYLKLNSDFIIKYTKNSFVEFLSARVNTMMDSLLELLEAYDHCIEYNKHELFYSIINLKEVKNIINAHDEMYRKTILKMKSS
jgi:hypothetical protein